MRLDLSGVTWLAAPMCAALGALIEHLRQYGAVTLSLPRKEKPRLLLERNGFAKAFGGRKLPDFYKSTIAYERQGIDDEPATLEYLRSRLLGRPEFAGFDSSVRRRIEHSFAEIRENAREHGRSSFLHVCGQLFPSKHELAIQIVDRGIGFKSCINEALGTNWSAAQCLEWAMQEGATTRSGDRPGGLGLKELRSFLAATGGSLIIVSGEGALSLTDGKSTIETLPYPLGITTVSVTFNTRTSDFAETDDAADGFF